MSRVVNAYTDADVTVIDLDIGGRGGSASFFFFSDTHLDSLFCQTDVFLSHLRQMAAAGAYFLCVGDMVDAMMGRYDPRRSQEELLPEFRGRDDYYDAVVDYVAGRLLPFKERLIFLGQGNHELAVKKHVGTDLSARVGRILNQNRQAPPVQVGGYTGYIVIRILTNGKPRANTIIYYAHGSGGAAPVTRGVIRTNRQAVFLENVAVVLNGHNHQGYVVPIVMEGVNKALRTSRHIVWFLRTPGYKNEWARERSGYVAQKNTGPHPLGGIVGILSLDGDSPAWQMQTLLTA